MKQIILTLALILLAGCSTQKIFSIDPIEKNTEVSEGRKIAVWEDSLSASTINFEGQYGTHLVFFTYFENNSDTTILVNPADFYFMFYQNSVNLEKRKLLIKRHAYDPELQIKAMNRSLNESGDEKAALTFLNCLFGTASAAVAIANDDEDDCDQTGDVIDAVGFTIGNQILIEEAYEEHEAELLARREFWKNEVLRKTTLYPGEKIGGLIHFPLHEEVGFLQINIPLGSKTHSYNFKQNLVE